MAVRRINAAIRRLDWDEIVDLLLRDDNYGDPAPIEVCAASVDDWNRYVISEMQELKSKNMEWRDGSIWIVELPPPLRGLAVGTFTIAMMDATGTRHHHLLGYGAAYIEDPPAGAGVEYLWSRIAASDHLGQLEQFYHPGCNIGPGIDCTVKVEIGGSRGWPSLNRKSAIFWREYPGVEYVVSIRLSPQLRTRENRFEQRVNGVFPGDDDVDRAPISPIDQNAILQFDAHRLLGLPADADLPPGFNDPVLINLFELVEDIRYQ